MFITTILKPHGVNGKLKVVHFDFQIQQIVLEHGLYDDCMQYTVSAIQSMHSKFLILTIDEIKTYTDALKIVGNKLYTKKECFLELSGDDYYTQDLIDTVVSLEDGTLYGIIIGIYNFGAGDIVELKLNNNETVMLSFTKNIFINNDIKNKTAIIRLPNFVGEQ